MKSFLCRFPRSFGLDKGMLPPWMHTLPYSSSSCVESREGGHEPGLCFSPPPAPCWVWLGGPWTWTHISLFQTYSQHSCTWPLSSMSSREERKFRERLQSARGGCSMDAEPTQRTLMTPTFACLFQAFARWWWQPRGADWLVCWLENLSSARLHKKLPTCRDLCSRARGRKKKGERQPLICCPDSQNLFFKWDETKFSFWFQISKPATCADDNITEIVLTSYI